MHKYHEALCSIIRRLKDSYPASRILVLSPGFIDIYSKGEMILSEYASPLQEYREAARNAASEQGCEFLSQTDDMGFTQDETGIYLLQDNVHYNEIGRYRLAQELARYFK